MFGATSFKLFAVANNKMLVIGFLLVEVVLLAFLLTTVFVLLMMVERHFVGNSLT